MLGVWPVALTAGLAFAIPQFLVSNFHGPSLVDVVASLCSLGATALLLKVWKPKEIWPMEGAPQRPASSFVKGQVAMAWMPWIILSLWVFAWGEPHIKKVAE